MKHKLAGVVENLVQKSQFTLFWDLVPRIPPPPENWTLGRSWHFKTFHFWLVENTPPPMLKIELQADLGISRLFTFDLWRIPPPLKENWNLGRSWHFKTFHFWLVENTPPPKFRRILAFQDFSLLTCGEYPPPPKLKFRQILAFQDFSLLTCGEYPAPPPLKIEI